MDSLLDWGVDKPLQIALIHNHPEGHEMDDIAELIICMEGPTEIYHRVKILKEEGNRCFKNGDFTHASSQYLSAISDADQSSIQDHQLENGKSMLTDQFSEGKQCNFDSREILAMPDTLSTPTGIHKSL